MIHSDPLRVRPQLLILTLLSFIGMTLIAFLFYSSMSDTLYQDKRDDTKLLINTGMGITAYYHQLESSGEMSREQAQAIAKETLRAARHSDDAYLWILDYKGNMLMHSTQPELEGKNFLDVRDSTGKPFTREFLRAGLAGGGWVTYFWPRAIGEEPFRKLAYVTKFEPWGWILGTALFLDETEDDIRSETLKGVSIAMLVAIVLIVASMVISNRFMGRLAEMATRDPLTGLHTRLYLNEIAPMLFSQQERNRDEQLAVIFLDIDLFKEINDTYGHRCGDTVLAEIGNIITASIRPSDVAVRFGGEEFVVFMFCTEKSDALALAERIRSTCSQQTFDFDETPTSVELSGGVTFRHTDETLEHLLNRADIALYAAKQQGRDRIVIQEAASDSTES